MKQLETNWSPDAHIEITFGLLAADGTKYTTLDVTKFLMELHKTMEHPLTFKVFSGYAPVVQGGAEIMHNMAMLHLDFNPTEFDHRFNILSVYVAKLMERFDQQICYAWTVGPSGTGIVTFALTEQQKGPAN